MSKNPTWTWYELMTTDPAGAQAFYAGITGWRAEPWPDPAMPYTILNSQSGGLGGIARLSEEAKAMGAPPHWLGVVGVPDVDATVNRAKELGGSVLAGPFDIPGVGRYALLADPTGAAFAVLAGEGEAPATEIDNNELGRVSWNELWSSDPVAALAFYTELFGWVSTGDFDMGPGGLYRMYGVAGAGRSLGGIAAKMPDQPVSAWAFYINVASADASLEQVKAAGGTVLFGPHEVPGGGRMGMCVDPQGAVFALYSHGAPA